jgi:hypothetical protein
MALNEVSDSPEFRELIAYLSGFDQLERDAMINLIRKGAYAQYPYPLCKLVTRVYSLLAQLHPGHQLTQDLRGVLIASIEAEFVKPPDRFKAQIEWL